MTLEIQDLNAVLPAQTQTDSQDFSSCQSYPEFAPQLDFWTNITFDSDEPLGSRYEERHKRRSAEPDGDETGFPSIAEVTHDDHVNIVAGSDLCNNQLTHPTLIHPSRQYSDPNALFAGYNVAPPPRQPSLAELRALYPNHTPGFPTASSPLISPYLTTTEERTVSLSRPTVSPPVPDDSFSSAGRLWTRKKSVLAISSPDDDGEGIPSASVNPLSASEEKRRRNTAASARFRLKKKEREATLEDQAKELKTRVHELERECEELRRENGWLKGLVVGDAQGSVVPAPCGNETTQKP